MNPKVGTIMGKFSVVAGVKQEQAMNVAAVKPARGILRQPKKERLYIILDVTGEPVSRDRIYSEMIRIIGEEFFRARGSVTAKLRQAIGAANSFLLQENLSALPLEQRAGGVTCVVFKEGNVYIAQVGPMVAYVSYQGKLKSFPEIPITELTAEEATPLGFKRGIPLRLYRTKVGLGDVILLTSGSLAQHVSREQIAQALTGKDVDVALASLEQLAGEGDASAMLVRVAPVEEKPRVRPQAAMRPARAKVEAAKEHLPRPDWRSLERRVSSLLANAWKATGDFLRRLLPEPAPPPAEAKGVTVPSKPMPQPRQPARPAKRGRNLWMSIAIAIPIIVVILVLTVYWRQGLARRARFEELITQARQQVEMAGQVDESTARGYLLKALDYLVEAEELRPGKSEVSELREQSGYILKKIDRVTELTWIQLLWEYREPGSNPGRVIVANDIDVYVLDEGLHRVYKHLLDEAKHALQALEVDPVLLRKGDQRDPIVVGDLIDMAWVQAEGWRSKDSLLVLESGGALLEYDPLKGISVLPVSGHERWIRPQIAGSYEGNFYLLDSSLNQILRYKPDYDGSPEDYFPASAEVNLAGVVDMALDGQIYLLYADGRILKFDNGQPAPFEITGLYEPMQNPTALFTSRESQFLYVADAGHKRILQFTKDGSLLRQLKAGQGEALTDLKGLFAIEKYNLLYLVSGNQLYVTNIPAE